MPRRRHSAEQIITKLREAGKYTGDEKRFDMPPDAHMVEWPFRGTRSVRIPFYLFSFERRASVKTIVVLIMIVLLPGAVMAQAPASPNSVYLEVAGNGLTFSVNYDRLVTGSFGGRVGFGYFSPSFVSMASFPLMAYYCIGSGNSKLELGLGACAILQPETQSFSFGSGDDEFEGDGILGTTLVGYRYQRAEGGIVFRVGVTPFFGKFVHYTGEYDPEYMEIKEDVYRFTFHGGISVGYAF